MGSFRLKPKWIPFCINCPSGNSFWVKQLIYETHFWWPHLFLLRKTESLTFSSNSLFKWGSLFLLKVFVMFRCVYIGRGECCPAYRDLGSNIRGSRQTSPPSPTNTTKFYEETRHGPSHLIYATWASPIMNLICPPKFCISIVFNFSWDGCNTQEKWNTNVIQNFGGQIRCIMGGVQVAYKQALTNNWSLENMTKNVL